MFAPFWKLLFGRQPAARKRFRRTILRLETLEERLTPANLTVMSNLDDGGAGTLRSIIAGASDGDTIGFDPSIAGAANQIILCGDIAFNKNLTIDGRTVGTTGLPNNVWISGGGVGRIFNIQGGRADGRPPQDTINNLTLWNSRDSSGGAIQTVGSLSLAGDTFRNNTADDGGAVYAGGSGTTLTVSNSYFLNNTAAVGSGGAIRAGDSLTIDNSEFSTNVAKGGGGAIDVFDLVTVTRSQFYDNASADSGGAIRAARGGSISGSTFDRNKAFWEGGAIRAVNAEDEQVLLSITGTDFTNNAVNNRGGAISVMYSASLSVSGGTFANNRALFGEGGAICARYTDVGNPPLQATVSLGNITFSSNTAEFGGAFASEVSGVNNVITEVVSGCLFNGNQALGGSGPAAGGAVYTHNTDDVSADGTTSGSTLFFAMNSTFYQNYSDDHGGAIALNNTTGRGGNNMVSLWSLTVYQNQAATAGGGLWLAPNYTIAELRNSIVAGNVINNPPDSGPDIFGTLVSRQYNLIGIGEGSGTTQWVDRKDLVGNPTAPINPGLDPNGLQPNGGPTLTIELLNTSIGYHAGDRLLAGSPDQRGFVRRLDAFADLGVSIGAYDPDAR